MTPTTTLDRPATLDAWKGRRVRVTARDDAAHGQRGTVCSVAMDEPAALDVLLDRGGFVFAAPAQLAPDGGRCGYGRGASCGCPAGVCLAPEMAVLEHSGRAAPRATEDADAALTVWDCVAAVGCG